MGSRPFQTFMAMYSHPSGSLKRRCVSTTLLSPVGCHCPSQPFLAVGLALGLNRMPLACHAAAARCSTSWLNFRLNIRQPVKYTIFSPARIVLNWDLNVVLFMGMGSSTFEEMRPTGNPDKRGDDDQGDSYCAVFAHGRRSTMKPCLCPCDKMTQSVDRHQPYILRRVGSHIPNSYKKICHST